MFDSVLVATDGSETAGQAVKVATEMARTFGATLHIANVYRSGGGGAVKVPEMTMAPPEGLDRGSVAETQTESVASEARAKGLTVETHVVSGNVADSVVAIAEKQNIGLIVVGNKGMKGIKRVLGSIPNDIAHSAPCAVLIVNTTS
jgi:nucleotide-binding universal stress UspA family protein